VKDKKWFWVVMAIIWVAAFTGRYYYDRGSVKKADLSNPALKAIPGDMMKVEGGTFTMGCADRYRDDCNEGTQPIHEVIVDGFYLCRYDVTQAQWSAVMDSNRSHCRDCPTCPVERVSWDDAQQFISRLNAATGKKYRLPSEAEWEYAAFGGRGAQRTRYAGGDSIDEVCWYYGNSDQKTHPVGLKKPNRLGLYDMCGNVDQWCSDWYDEEYYSHSPHVNPKGAESGKYHSLRGGDYLGLTDGITSCGIVERYSLPLSDRSLLVGFRLAEDL
jgi:sulfatase modifying factor 1